MPPAGKHLGPANSSVCEFRSRVYPRGARREGNPADCLIKFHESHRPLAKSCLITDSETMSSYVNVCGFKLLSSEAIQGGRLWGNVVSVGEPGQTSQRRCSVLGLGWWTGSKLEEKVEEGPQAGAQQTVWSRNVSSGVVGITSWMELLYLRRERALVSSGVHVFTGALCLCPVLPYTVLSGLWHELTGAHSARTSGASGKCLLVPGHFPLSCQCYFLYHLCSSLSMPAPLPRIHAEAQTLSSADEARV